MAVKTGLSLLRYIQKLKRDLAKQIASNAKHSQGGTTRQQAKVATIKKELAMYSKETKQAKTAADKAKVHKLQVVKQAPDTSEWKHPPGTAKKASVKKEAKKTKSRTRKQKRKLARLTQAQKKDIASEKKTISTAGGTRVRTFTEEGRDLYESADPADHERLLKSLLQEKYGGTKGVTLAKTSRLVRDALNAPLVPKGVLDISDAEFAKLSTLAKIDHLMGRTAPALTKSQAARAIRGTGQPLVDPVDIKMRRGFQEFKKGGLSQKKYQKTMKYGGKEYVYMGGGLVGDISHFKKKRDR